MKRANSKRKSEHLEIALNEVVESTQITTGLEGYRFVHQALPELDMHTIDLSCSLFGRRLTAPLIISSMVGGIEPAKQINRNLARAAQALGLAMGVGSQRVAIDDPETASTYAVRDIAPDILLFANMGAVQLNNGYALSQCQRMVGMIGADALILHLNPLQEALQQGGNTNFSGLLSRIEKVCRSLGVPVVVKEVGWGISEAAARRLAAAGVAAIDVAGAGGTAWSEVERFRSKTEKANNIAAAFSSWGIPTADSIAMARRGAPGLPLIASGGLRTGLDVAKAIALGADAAGIAAPLLKAATISPEAVIDILDEVTEALRISMFCIGAASLDDLKNTPLLERAPRSGR
ncbi:MAG: type 2 isopentenyl-diphosphate Delta-isomerase [Dehalococcoidia bacterium]|nr:type 2 isopentenyl-diphosphate Delta-isomerase [Dehalococcoidia bacterium]